MLILNVSDIHFKYPVCTTEMDPDRPYRTLLVQDAKKVLKNLGSSIEAIVVSGDVAYAGKPLEYEEAYKWLASLAEACGCKLERVFVVPGNHDVDREVARSNQKVRDVHREIKRAKDKKRHEKLLEQFQNLEAGRALLLPIEAYNAFAAKFQCEVFPPERLFWKQEIPIDHGVHLRFYGLTSTLLSGFGGKNDKRTSLYLSPLQTALDPVEGFINVVVCHHPPDWFMDTDDIEDAICGRSPIHFFGHKHRQRILMERNYARFSAGAVNPDHSEPRWEPGYNIVKIETVKRDGLLHLILEAHLRVWQTNPDGFHAKRNKEDKEVFHHEIPLHWEVPAMMVDKIAVASDSVASDFAAATSSTSATDLEATMSDERTRNLVLRFWNLPSSDRREIALTLGIINEEEIRKYPEAERYGRALRRAGQRGLMDRLSEEIASRERK